MNHFILLISIILFTTPCFAQSKKPARTSLATLEARESEARNELIKAAEDYKKSLLRLVLLQQQEVREAEELLERRKTLFSQNRIEKRDLDAGEQLIVAAKAKVAETLQEISRTDQLVEEVRIEEQLARMPKPRINIALRPLVKSLR